MNLPEGNKSSSWVDLPVRPSHVESQADDNDLILEESNLLDVVTFPVAFTNSALHEIKLLKILLDIGAPNHYAFQSFIDW